VATAAQKLRDAGVTVFVLGITPDVDPDQLRVIAGPAGLVFTRNSFQQLGPAAIVELGLGSICHDTTTAAATTTIAAGPNVTTSTTAAATTTTTTVIATTATTTIITAEPNAMTTDMAASITKAISSTHTGSHPTTAISSICRASDGCVCKLGRCEVCSVSGDGAETCTLCAADRFLVKGRCIKSLSCRGSVVRTNFELKMNRPVICIWMADA